MKTTFRIENENFVPLFKIVANGSTYYIEKDLTIEYSDCEQLEIDLELVHTADYIKSKNPFLRFLWNVAIWIFSPLLFFIDNDDGIREDRGFSSFTPFTLKQSFSINAPDEKTITINYTDSQYDRLSEKYTPPIVRLHGDTIIQHTEDIAFSATVFKREWNTYHIPGFTVLTIVVLLLNWLCFSLFAKVIREIPLFSLAENIGHLIGISFCSLVMIALFVACIIRFIKLHKFYKKVLQINS